MASIAFQPKNIGREFVRRYYTILNHSPENLHCFYNENAIFVHDDIDPNEAKTISVVGKQAIRDVMKARSQRHRCTIINGIDTIPTINNGLVVQVYGEIAHGIGELRPFSQSFILAAASPIKFYVHNEIFRFRDFAPIVERSVCQLPSIVKSTPLEVKIAQSESESESIDTKCQSEIVEISDEENETSTRNSTPNEKSNDGEINKSETMEINELQSQHLKNLLQEMTKNNVDATKNLPSNIVNTTVASKTADGSVSKHVISEQATKLFQDTCIITVGNVVNPNIDLKFDENHNNIEVEDNEAVKQTEAEQPKPTKPEEKPISYAESLKSMRAKTSAKRSGSASSVSSTCESSSRSASKSKIRRRGSGISPKTGKNYFTF